MSNIVKTFAELINEGNKAAKMITEPDKRAMAYAALAQAIAETGAVNFDNLNANEEVENSEPKAKKEDIKAGADKGTTSKKAKSKKASPKKEEKVEEMTDIIAESQEEEKPEEKTEETMPSIDEEAVAPETESEDDGDEWTDELQEKYAEEINFLNEVAEAYGEDEVYGRILLEWSQDQFSGIENVTPSNVQAFAYYVQSLVDAAEEE